MQIIHVFNRALFFFCQKKKEWKKRLLKNQLWLNLSRFIIEIIFFLSLSIFFFIIINCFQMRFFFFFVCSFLNHLFFFVCSFLKHFCTCFTADFFNQLIFFSTTESLESLESLSLFLWNQVEPSFFLPFVFFCLQFFKAFFFKQWFAFC